MSSFEKEIETLQAIVKRLETGELSLEDSMTAFEEGVRIAKACQQKLAEAEKKVELLTRVTADGQIETRKFNEDED